MEPEIRYTTTADGVSIAYYTMGEGLPLLVTSNVLWSHLRFQRFREYHRNGNGLGRGLQVVRYDARDWVIRPAISRFQHGGATA